MNQPDNLSTVSERGRSRYAAAFRAGVTGLGARGTAIVTTLISLPFVERYLSDERFGLYLTLLSLTAFLSFTDFGVGNGLKTQIAQATGREEITEVRSLVSNACVFLALVAVAGIGLATLLFLTMPWAAVFNVSDPRAMAEAGPAVFILMVCFLLSLPLTVVRHTQQALQQGHLASIWEGLGSVTTLIALISAIALEATLPMLILAFMGGPILTRLANTLWYFGRAETRFAPSYSFVERATIRSLVGTGGLFVVLQLAGAGAFMSDNMVVAQFIGPSSVQELALPAQLFGIISMLTSVMLAPFWPAYGEAYSRGDVAWVLRALKLSILIAGSGALVGGVVLSVLSPWILDIWVGDAVEASATLLVGLALWKTLEAMGVAAAMYLNGVMAIGIQVVLAILLLVTAIPTKIVFATSFGVAGIPWATSVCYGFTTLIPIALWAYFSAAGYRRRAKT